MAIRRPEHRLGNLFQPFFRTLLEVKVIAAEMNVLGARRSSELQYSSGILSQPTAAGNISANPSGHPGSAGRRVGDATRWQSPRRWALRALHWAPRGGRSY